MPNVSLIYSKMHVRGQQPISSILRQIRKGTYQDRIVALREEVQYGRSRANFIQSQLPHFTPSGRFQDFYQLEYLVRYTGIIRTDVGAKAEEVLNLRSMLKKIPYVYACFLNAPANAMTILTRSSNEVLWHWSAAKAIGEYYRRKLKRRSGVRSFGIMEGCTFSYDPMMQNPMNVTTQIRWKVTRVCD